MNREEVLLLALLRQALWGSEGVQAEGVDWQRLLDLAERHSVLSLLYDSLGESPQAPEEVRRQVERESRRIVLQSYRLLFLGRYLARRLAEAGLPCVVLKGVSAAAPYPTPELRKSGDVDLLLLKPQAQKAACRVLEESGCVRAGKQLARHHVEFSLDGIGVELHTMLAEPFDHKPIDRFLQKKLWECADKTENAEIMGVDVPVLRAGCQAFQLLLHMLQHYLRQGFGLKLLCDWAALWARRWEEEERRAYLALVEESGLKGFSDAVTLACCQHLGLAREAVDWMALSAGKEVVRELMDDIMKGGEFGGGEAERMLTLGRVSLVEPVQKVHRQMCVNFPRASRCFLCWPVLYVLTLARFWRNNRRLRHTSARAILRMARERGRLREKLGLWR